MFRLDYLWPLGIAAIVACGSANGAGPDAQVSPDTDGGDGGGGDGAPATMTGDGGPVADGGDGGDGGGVILPTGGTCATNPWPNEHGCSDALGHTTAKGPGSAPSQVWSKTFAPFPADPQSYWYTTNLRIDARGRLVALTSHQAGGGLGDTVSIFDGATGDESDISGAATLALGAGDVVYECYSDSVRGSNVVALDTTPPLTAPPPQRWSTSVFAKGDFGPCTNLVATDDGLVISALSGTVTALNAADGSKRFSVAFEGVMSVAAEATGPIYVQAFRETTSDARPHVIALDRTSGAVVWEFTYDASTDDGSFGAIDGDRYLLGAVGGGALGYARSPTTFVSTIYFQNAPGAPAWTAAFMEESLHATATGTSVFLAGNHTYATLDLATHAVSTPITSGFGAGVKKVLADARGYRYVLGEQPGESTGAITAYDATGTSLFSLDVFDSPDFVIGDGGWLYVSTRPGLIAYRGTPERIARRPAS